MEPILRSGVEKAELSASLSIKALVFGIGKSLGTDLFFRALKSTVILRDPSSFFTATFGKLYQDHLDGCEDGSVRVH